MRRIVSLCLLAGFLLLMTTLDHHEVVGQFATNTPAADTTNDDNTTDDTTTDVATATPTPGNSLFATNTPDVPSATPTNTVTPSPTMTFTPSPTPVPNGPFSYPDGINPLTGLPYPDEEARARANLIIKISNFPPIVRPQRGVNQADVVYEYEAEGGVTRFAAIFRSQAPDIVGSVRSGRLMDMELVTMYRALLSYSGTSAPVRDLFQSSGFYQNHIGPFRGNNCADAGFCRLQRTSGEELATEHTLFSEPAKIWDVATERGVNTGFVARGFAFDEMADEGGEAAIDIRTNWYGNIDARWQYDEITGRYVRYTDGEPHFDALDGQQLWADNVVILTVDHVRRPDLFAPGAANESLQVELWDQGFAYLVRDGKAYQGFWRRANREPGSALQLIYGDNTPMMMKPGRTWVAVMRGFGDVTLSDTLTEMPEAIFEPQPDLAPTGAN
ncbi:MAG: DUF3048 domain-containing protein [Aggregatilineales bacterium]